MADPKTEGTNYGSNLKTLVTTASNSFVEENLDTPGILFFEHSNMQVGSKDITRIFYQDILGMTPDPSPSFHYNIGQQQFHFMLAKDGEASHVVCGCIGISVPSLERVLFACKEVGQRLLLKHTVSNTTYRRRFYLYKRSLWKYISHLPDWPPW